MSQALQPSRQLNPLQVTIWTNQAELARIAVAELQARGYTVRWHEGPKAFDGDVSVYVDGGGIPTKRHDLTRDNMAKDLDYLFPPL